MRAKEAEFLFQNSFYPAAYYLAVYGVECALKACIAKQICQHDFPDKRLILDSYTHDLERLLNISGIKAIHDAEVASNPQFGVYWNIVTDWSEESRYDKSVDAKKAGDLIEAVLDPQNGVLIWLKKHW